MITSGSLAGVQEYLASYIANDKNKDGGYFTSRVAKMTLYGAFISAPMSHVLTNMLQWIFAGKTSVRAKVAQILVSNLVVRDTSSSMRHRCLHDPSLYPTSPGGYSLDNVRD